MLQTLKGSRLSWQLEVLYGASGPWALRGMSYKSSLRSCSYLSLCQCPNDTAQSGFWYNQHWKFTLKAKFHFRNGAWKQDQIQKCMPVTLWSSTSSNSISVPPSSKFICEYAFHEVLAYKLETYTNTNSRFQISSYHDFEAAQIKHQVWCAASEAWSLCGIIGSIIRSLLKPAPKTPHASLATSGMPEALWHCSHFLWPLRLKWLLTPQLRKCDVEQGEETTLTYINCFAWAYKQIVVGFVLEASLLNVGHQHGKITSGSPVDYEKK